MKIAMTEDWIKFEDTLDKIFDTLFCELLEGELKESVELVK